MKFPPLRILEQGGKFPPPPEKKAGDDPDRVKIGNRGVQQAQRRKPKEQEQEKKVTDGLLGIRHMVSWSPFQEKGSLRDHFQGLPAYSVVFILVDFFTLLGHFGAKSAKSSIAQVLQQWPFEARWEVQNGQKLKIWPHGAVYSAFWTEHCMLKALENGLLGDPFPERVVKRPFFGWLIAHPSLLFLFLFLWFPPLRLLPLYCLMLTLFDPIVWPPVVQWSH